MKRLLIALCVAALAVSADAREGFGFKKKAVDVMRTIPPSTNAGARRVRVTVTSERDSDDDDAKTLARYISDAILSGGGTLAESGKPEVTIGIEVDRLDSHETWETKTETEYRQTGTQQVWNESKKKYETKPVYGNVTVTKNIKVVEARLSGAFDIRDKSSEVASSSLDQEFKEKYEDGTGAPSPSRAEDDLLRRAANGIASRLVPTQDRVSILVPRASFEPLIPYAESGDWTSYLAAVEAMPTFRGAKEEAFRQYALAIAKEALAYRNEDRREALEMLRAAVTHYEAAISSNSGEELFRQGYSSLLTMNTIGAPLARAKESVTRYAAWTGTASAPRVASAAPAPAPAAKKNAMRNQTVIDLAKAGLSDENIIMAIDAAKETDFDVSPNGLIALSKSGVSKQVIAHMQRK
ncbi:MAG TPA: hypothetical protein VNA69_16765 [Thermoanaerobaculia bacterium]|nr:hypothetical protein [Thermoanaerobaculia bacterium]